MALGESRVVLDQLTIAQDGAGNRGCERDGLRAIRYRQHRRQEAQQVRRDRNHVEAPSDVTVTEQAADTADVDATSNRGSSTTYRE